MSVSNSNPYRVLGLGLCVGAAFWTPIAYFVIASVPLTAIGVSVLFVGITCMALANTRPGVSPEACEMLLRTGMENTAALLEELGLNTRAVYLPSAVAGEQARAVIPLNDTYDFTQTLKKIPERLIVRYGNNPEDMALAVTTPGSVSVGMLETKPGPSAEEIQTATTYILTGLLDIANSITVNLKDGEVFAEVKAPRLGEENIWYYRCLGSPIASIVAAIASEALNKPVRIKDEKFTKGAGRIVIEVLS